MEKKACQKTPQKLKKTTKKQSKKTTEKTRSDPLGENPPRASVEKKQRAVYKGVNQNRYLKYTFGGVGEPSNKSTSITFLKKSASRNPPRPLASWCVEPPPLFLCIYYIYTYMIRIYIMCIYALKEEQHVPPMSIHVYENLKSCVFSKR